MGSHVQHRPPCAVEAPLVGHQADNQLLGRNPLPKVRWFLTLKRLNYGK